MDQGNTKKFDINQLQILHQQINQDLDVLISYEGIFSKEKIRELGMEISKITQGDYTAYKKLFYVFIELAQNVSNYSDWRQSVQPKGSAGVGAIIIGETAEDYLMIIGNVINNKDLQVLIRKCEIINSLDRDSLRLFKRQQRNLIPGTNQNAHIGLIMVALTTRKKLDLTIKPLNDEFSYFVLRVLIPKNKRSTKDQDNN